MLAPPLYGCPRKALTPGIGKFMVIKEGLNLSLIEKRMLGVEELEPIEKLAKGFLWKGIK